MLAQRVAAAVVAIPILLVLIWFGGWPYAIAAALVLMIASAEFVHLRYDWLHVYTSLAVASVGFVTAAAATEQPGWLIGTAILSLSTVFQIFAPAVRGHVRRVSLLPSVVVFTATLYVGVLGSAIILLRELEDGRDWVLLALFTTFAVDTAAYFVGRAIGRHRLAPSISPKKTWEGFAGGWAGGLTTALALNAILDTGASIGAAMLIGVTLPLAATAGDLLESWIKRRAGVKDASELIPGHGGLLDRLDSVLFTFPLVYVVARWLA